MAKPWEDTGPTHDIREKNDEIYVCDKCGKHATAKSKLQMTVCEE